MTELAIGTLAARYHLPPSRQAERARLDRILPEAAGEALAILLERAGLPQDGELCIREIRVPLRLRLGAGDNALLLAWAEALAAAVAAAWQRGEAEEVLHFGSRRQALVDFALGVAGGDLRHAWAWQQLGLADADFGPGEAATALARALAAEPEALVRVLAEVATAGLLPALAARFDKSWWPQLAARALATVGWPALPLGGGRAEAAPAPEGVATAGAAAGASPRWRPLEDAGRQSRLATLFEILAAKPESPLGQALAALVWLELEPGRLRGIAPADRGELLAATAALLAPAPTATPAAPAAASGEAVAASAAAAPGAADPAAAGSAAATTPALPATVAAVPASAAAEPTAGAADASSLVSRRYGVTAWGGLLFLVGVADEIGLPEEIDRHPALAARPQRWCWHQLALQLAPIGPDDPAALAFCGLLPGNPSPAFEAPPANAEELAALAALSARLRDAAADLYWERGRPARSPAEAEERDPGTGEEARTRESAERARTGAAFEQLVLRRQARVLADPGWIEIHFSLADVDTALRRACLDLDPGFVPWLGVVLRFYYE